MLAMLGAIGLEPSRIVRLRRRRTMRITSLRGVRNCSTMRPEASVAASKGLARALAKRALAEAGITKPAVDLDDLALARTLKNRAPRPPRPRRSRRLR